MEKPTKHLFLKGIFGTLLVFILVVMPVKSSLAQGVDVIGGPTTVVTSVVKKVSDKLATAFKKVSANLFQTTITNALKRVAYDTAAWIGSGDNGQKPLFLTGEPGKYLGDLADAAAGDFIDAFAAETNINFCQPNLDVKIKIGLGLNARAGRIPSPSCKASTMFKAWKTDINAKYAAMTSPTFLKDMSSMFSVGGSDISLALDVMDGLDAQVSKKTADVTKELDLGGGWFSKKNIGGQITEPPGTAERALTTAANTTAEAQKVSPTEAVLTDTAKVFLNTLATTAFNKAIRNLASGDWTSLTYGLYKGKTDQEIADLIKSGSGVASNVSCLNDPNCDPSAQQGASAVKSNLADMIRPTFDSRGDYDILGELGVCSDPANPGPTNCILDSQFSSAISERKTVIEAINEGFLNKSWRLKRDIDFNQGYSLRSLLVLRKFRIIPVGWETALLKAEENNVNVTLMDMVSCFDPNDNYNEFSQGFTPAVWCQGLIDPNWVLKAPLNYCKREGYGNQILDKTLIPGQTVGGVEIPGEIILTRADEYCADEQSCIKEKTDGTCEAYGYCTEEKRTWDFTSDSCEAIYNTCQTFVKSNGASASYLENTIDYSTCNADNAGCRPYSVSGSYDVSADKISWNSLNHLYFSKKAEACDSSQEGCQELIRVTPEAGHNFLINSDFEEDLNIGSWNVNIDDVNVSTPNAATTTAGGYFSDTALTPNGILKKNVVVGPNDYNISGRNYTFSFYAKNCSDGDQAVLGNNTVDDKTIDLGGSTDWNYYYVTYNFPLGLTDNHVYISLNSNTCQIDRLKLELAQAGTEYSDYYQNSLVYQKLIPDYLASTCYVNPNSATPDYSLKTNAPAKCFNYTRRCNASEVDCDLHQSVRDGFTLPAKITPFDACLAECDGYDSYVQKAASFSNTSAANFIPTTATKCSANAVGCTEFTNLDSVAQGGEGREYYSFLRQCIKPNDNQCGVFYSWGSAGTSYQLQPYKLQAFADKPILTSGSFDTNRNQIDEDVNIVCSEAIYNSTPSDAAYNSDCRQLYNKDGAIFYALYSQTITCSDDCHPYRISENPIDETIANPADCVGGDAHWDAANAVCYVCKNGGVWDDNQNGCLYQAIPGEGQTCSAGENGCREYNGNYGNNLRIVNVYDFENNRVWASSCNDSSSLSSDSINKNGHSLQYDYAGGNCSNSFVLDPIIVSNTEPEFNLLAAVKGFWNKMVRGAEAQTGNALPGHSIGITVGQSVKQNSAYVLRFLAKANTNVAVNFYLSNGAVASQFDANSQNNGSVFVSGNNEWKMYAMNLASLDHEVTGIEALLFSATGNVLLDNITLTEITDRFYLIKDSWNTPDACYYDTFGIYQGTNYNLGCSAYTNRAGQTNYLRNFSHLCSDSSAGCELMSLTNNSASSAVQAFQEVGTPDNNCDVSDGLSCVEVPADKMIYVVYNPAKQCGSENKGCTRLGGQTAVNPDVTVQNLYADVYLKNNPDKYDSILCNDTEVGCDEWKYLDGQSSYFKDPGENVCEWRQPTKATGMDLPKKWYKKTVKRCDFNDNDQIDVDINGTITETQNRLCGADADCGVGNCILDTNDYLCDVNSLKTIGLGGGNLVYQPQNMVGTCEAKASGCTEYIDPVSEFSPNIVINPSWGDLNGDGIRGDAWATSTAPIVGQKQIIYLLKNKLYSFSAEASNVTPTQNTTLICPASVRILGSDNSFTAVTNTIAIPAATSKNILFNSLNNVSCTIYGAEDGKTINIRGTVVDYKLIAGVDKTTCNGAANFNSGCILFNERKQNGVAGLSALNWKAFGGSYQIGLPVVSATDGDSNVLVKVKPNRVCSKWLSCLSAGIDATSGEETCYALGECDKLGDSGLCQSFVNKPEVQHTFDSGSDRNIAGYSKMDNYYLSNMSEVGDDLSNAHWDFETNPYGVASSSVITDVAQLPANISYPAHGKNLLKVSAPIIFIDNFGLNKDREYYVNFLVNIDNTAGVGATLSIVDNNSALAITNSLAQDSFSVASGSGWQRKVFKFIPVRDVLSASIKLSATSSDAFFDDINIEPVLKVADNTYVPKECRLYPKQDSLTCKSSQTNIISNGLYGYCLEHDPKNPEVCLMWYPIDNVKSSEASAGASTGFNGYTNSGANPSYCPAVSVNFDFVEKRMPSFAGYYAAAYNDYFPNPIPSPTADEQEYLFYAGHWADGALCGPSSGYLNRCTSYATCQGACTPTWNGTSIDQSGCFGQNNAHYIFFFHYPDDTPIVAGEEVDFSANTRAESGNDYCQWYPPAPGYNLLLNSGMLWVNTAGNNHFRLPSGWYKYNGTQGHDTEIKILDYDRTTLADCPSGLGDLMPLVGGSSGCLMDVNDYQPKCVSSYLESDIAWVNRVKNISTAASAPFMTYSPYKYYNNTRLSAGYNPYGPKQIDSSSPILGNTGAGVPWGCINSNNRKYYYSGTTASVDGVNYAHNSSNNNICMAIATSNGTYANFSATSSAPGIGLVSDGTAVSTTTLLASINHGLKNLFLQFKYGNVTYDYSNFKTSIPSLGISTIPACNAPSGVGPRNNSWCGIYPTIDNKKLTDPSGNLMAETSPGSGVYLIKTPGFYRLTFGATLDPEQFPIKKIVIDWGDDSDPMVINSETDPSQNFSFIRYYNPVDQTSGDPIGIKIKVMDNWGFFKCVGLANTCMDPAGCCRDDFDPAKKSLGGSCYRCLD